MKEFEGFIFPNGRIVAIVVDGLVDTLERLVQIRNRIFMSLIKLVTWSIRMMLWIRPLRQKI